jgi:hypothetical protein
MFLYKFELYFLKPSSTKELGLLKTKFTFVVPLEIGWQEF